MPSVLMNSQSYPPSYRVSNGAELAFDLGERVRAVAFQRMFADVEAL